MTAWMQKPFKVVAIDDDEARLVCPRTGCGGEFVVNRAGFREGRREAGNFATRPCPYCFGVSLVPKTSGG